MDKMLSIWSFDNNILSLKGKNYMLPITGTNTIAVSHTGKYALTTKNSHALKPSEKSWKLSADLWEINDIEVKLIKQFYLDYTPGRYIWIAGVNIQWSVSDIFCVQFPSSCREYRTAIIGCASTDTYKVLDKEEQLPAEADDAFDSAGNLIAADGTALDPNTLCKVEQPFVSRIAIYEEKDEKHRRCVYGALYRANIINDDTLDVKSLEFVYGEYLENTSAECNLMFMIYKYDATYIANIWVGTSTNPKTIIGISSATISPDYTRIAFIKHGILEIYDAFGNSFTIADLLDSNEDTNHKITWYKNRTGSESEPTIIVNGDLYSDNGKFIRKLPGSYHGLC